jgi:mycothiol synthase
MDEPAVEVASVVDTSLVDEVTGLLERAQAAGDRSRLSEGRVRALRLAAASRPPQRFLAVVARDRAGGLVGYAQIDSDPSGSTAEVVVLTAAAEVVRLTDRLLDEACGQFASAGGGPLRLWAHRPDADTDRMASARGFTMERDLLQLRCALPLPGPVGDSDAVVATRPFRVGVDEPAWVTTNNRAFDGHPEQGRWDLATIEAREREPWFEADGFRVLEIDGHMVGSCWTKVHREFRPPVGEIYVISVDPDYHGHGWGRALTRAGLDWLGSQGIGAGMLYVDSANVAAVGMYRSMGFAPDGLDRCYLSVIPGSGPD